MEEAGSGAVDLVSGALMAEVSEEAGSEMWRERVAGGWEKVAEVMAAGVPVMIPVEASKSNPVGSDGETAKPTGVAPMTSGSFGVIGVPAM